MYICSFVFYFLLIQCQQFSSSLDFVLAFLINRITEMNICFSWFLSFLYYTNENTSSRFHVVFLLLFLVLFCFQVWGFVWEGGGG